MSAPLPAQHQRVQQGFNRRVRHQPHQLVKTIAELLVPTQEPAQRPLQYQIIAVHVAVTHQGLTLHLHLHLHLPVLPAVVRLRTTVAVRLPVPLLEVAAIHPAEAAEAAGQAVAAVALHQEVVEEGKPFKTIFIL